MKYVLLCFTLLMGTLVFAQQPMKFGHINSQEVLMVMPEIDEIETQMLDERTLKEGQLKTMQEDLTKQQEAYSQIAESLTPEERVAKEQELQEMGQKAQNFYLLAQQQLQSKQQKLIMPVMQKIQTAIQEVGVENGFLYIFEIATGVPVYHSEKSVDVGPLVKAKLGITN